MANHHNIKILNSEANRFSETSNYKLAKLGDVTNITDASRKELIYHIGNIDILFICIKNMIDLEILNNAPDLKYIVTPTTGVNHIDLKSAERRNVKVLSLRGQIDFLNNITATAELTWGLLLCLVRKINSAHHHVVNNNWDRNQFYGNELKGKRLGIIGYGRLGSIVADYGLAFRMNVVSHEIDENRRKDSKIHEFLAIEDLLRTSDIVSVHIPLNDNNKNYLDNQKLSLMKKGAYIINTSRGEVIDEEALFKKLISKDLAGAAIDVMRSETSCDSLWIKNDKLKIYAEKNSNLIITPHIGGVTYESVEATNNFMIDMLRNVLINDGYIQDNNVI